MCHQLKFNITLARYFQKFATTVGGVKSFSHQTQNFILSVKAVDQEINRKWQQGNKWLLQISVHAKNKKQLFKLFTILLKHFYFPCYDERKTDCCLYIPKRAKDPGI